MITTTWAILWIPPAEGDEVTEPDDDGAAGAAGAGSVARRGVDDEVHATAARAMAAPAARSDQCLGMTQSLHRKCEGKVCTRRRSGGGGGGQGGAGGARGPIARARPVPGGNGTRRAGRRGD